MKIIHLLKSSLQIETPSTQNYHVFVLRFKGEQHVGVKRESIYFIEYSFKFC